jgi:cell wall-associated NlpC family hydrolase
VRCAVDIAPIRAEPRDDAEQVTQALHGEPLRVEERRDGWARVRTGYDYPGWMREEALEEGAGQLPPPAAGDPVAEARSFLGSPYLWGGMTAEGIDEQEDAGREVDEPQPGDLVTYGEADGPADHIAFWLGEGRILHATGRDGGLGVVEEDEPASLRARRRKFVRL